MRGCYMAMNLREKRTHGTTFYPLHVYSHHDKDGFYSVANESDFDSEPYAKLNSSKIEVVR